MSILEEIFEHKRSEVFRQREILPLAQVKLQAEAAQPPQDFVAALLGGRSRPSLIAEVKFASPSRGSFALREDPLALAAVYQDNGAAAVSVLTDERYFKGHLDHLRVIAEHFATLPLLRKEFIFDPYQLFQSRAAGASAVLLIAAALSHSQFRELHQISYDLGMAALVEVHSSEELQAALSCGPNLIGINNRNLSDFSVNLNITRDLLPEIPAGICVVSESGIHTPADYSDLDVDAILVGEAIATAPDVAAKVRDLAGLPKTVQRRVLHGE